MMSTEPSIARSVMKAATPLVAVAALLLTACPSTRWLERSEIWDAEGREHNAPSVMAWAGAPDPEATWPGGVVGLYMIEGYVRHWPQYATAPYPPDGEYLVVMMLHHDETDADEMAATANRECRRYDAARKVPPPFLLMQGGDLRSHVHLCVTAELAAALEQPEDRERAEDYLRRAGFRFSPAELPLERRPGL